MTPVFDKSGHAIQSGNILVYYFDDITGEYIGWSDEYINEGVSLPGNSTSVNPGEHEKGFVFIFKNGKWDKKEDHRGEVVYSKTTLLPVVIDYIGPVSDGYTVDSPSSIFDKWENGKWVTDKEAQKADETAQVNAQKNSLIAEATMKIAPLLDAKEGGYMDQEDLPILTAWQKYRYALTRVDVNKPVWPEKPE